MGTKKKGKKKKKDLRDATDATSPPPSAPITLNDVSRLLFGPEKLPFALPFIGPISIVERGTENICDAESLVVHGRGLIATRDVSQGECLFVIPSIVSADADEVRRRYLQQEGGRGDGADLEKITEHNLVEKVLRLSEILYDQEIHPKQNVESARRLLVAFSAQMNSAQVPSVEIQNEWMSILVGNGSSSCIDKINLGRSTIVDTIRRNAFGPDYHNYDAIAQAWTKRTNTENCYNRLLGVYPLSAMINHSCSPNAVRVFGCIPLSNIKATSEIDNMHGREVMIVHANANITKGDEITWSYLPPSTPFDARREILQSKYGFTCQCLRCCKEEVAVRVAEFKELWARAGDCWSSRDGNARRKEAAALQNLVTSIENAFTSTKQISNESQRYLRVGYSSLYMKHINTNLSLDSNDKISEALKLCTQLHFSFLSCNNASTEHLSILHLCYELSALLHTRTTREGNPSATVRTMSQVRFWTEQLKKAHMIRYGELGQDLENVRKVMKQSKLILRNVDGWFLATDRFI